MTGKDTIARDDVEKRRHQVERLLQDGLSEREIARALGVSRTTVWTDKQVLAARATV